MFSKRTKILRDSQRHLEKFVANMWIVFNNNISHGHYSLLLNASKKKLYVGA